MINLIFIFYKLFLTDNFFYERVWISVSQDSFTQWRLKGIWSSASATRPYPPPPGVNKLNMSCKCQKLILITILETSSRIYSRTIFRICRLVKVKMRAAFEVNSEPEPLKESWQQNFTNVACHELLELSEGSIYHKLFFSFNSLFLLIFWFIKQLQKMVPFKSIFL